MCGFLRKDGTVPLGSFVFGEPSLAVCHDPCVAHGDKDVLAFGCVESLDGETVVSLGEDGRPEEVLVVLWRFNSPVCVLLDGPSSPLEPSDGSLVVCPLTGSRADVSVFVTVEVDDLT